MIEDKLPMLPPDIELETKPVLRQLAGANRALAELKGYAATIPNKHILINAVIINEAKDSSAIENIITTHDELYKAMSQAGYKKPGRQGSSKLSYSALAWLSISSGAGNAYNEYDHRYPLPGRKQTGRNT
jgi:hypothetical protein